jgi:hypothetical protein
MIGGTFDREDSSLRPIALIYDGTDTCTGVLVSRHQVVTPASCVGAMDPRSMRVFLGILDATMVVKDESYVSTEVFGVSSLYPHQGFDSRSLDNNIAVVELDSSSRVTAAQVPRQGSYDGIASGVSLDAYSWVIDSDGPALNSQLNTLRFTGVKSSGVSLPRGTRAVSTSRDESIGHFALIFDRSGVFQGFSFYDETRSDVVLFVAMAEYDFNGSDFYY